MSDEEGSGEWSGESLLLSGSTSRSYDDLYNNHHQDPLRTEPPTRKHAEIVKYWPIPGYNESLPIVKNVFMNVSEDTNSTTGNEISSTLGNVTTEVPNSASNVTVDKEAEIKALLLRLNESFSSLQDKLSQYSVDLLLESDTKGVSSSRNITDTSLITKDKKVPKTEQTDLMNETFKDTIIENDNVYEIPIDKTDKDITEENDNATGQNVSNSSQHVELFYRDGTNDSQLTNGTMEALQGSKLYINQTSDDTAQNNTVVNETVSSKSKGPHTLSLVYSGINDVVIQKATGKQTHTHNTGKPLKHSRKENLTFQGNGMNVQSKHIQNLAAIQGHMAADRLAHKNQSEGGSTKSSQSKPTVNQDTNTSDRKVPITIVRVVQRKPSITEHHFKTEQTVSNENANELQDKPTGVPVKESQELDLKSVSVVKEEERENTKETSNFTESMDRPSTDETPQDTKVGHEQTLKSRQKHFSLLMIKMPHKKYTEILY